MGTAIAGQKVQGVCINGTVLKGACQNGTVFYKKATVSVALTNLIENGSFEDGGVSGWNISGGSISRVAVSSPTHGEFGSACAHIQQTVNGTVSISIASALVPTTVIGNIYYLRARTRYSSNGYANVAQFRNNAALIGTSVTMTLNTWALLDMLWTATNASLPLYIQFTGGNGNQQRMVQADNIMLIDLTSAFGAGQEPALADIREAVNAAGGWWDGAKTISV